MMNKLSLAKRKNLNLKLSPLSMKKTIQPNIGGVSQVFPFLWLGSKINAFDKQLLFGMKEIPNKVDLVINVSKDINNKFIHNKVNSIEHIRIPVNDDTKEEISVYFELVYQYIENARKKNKIVFIHCHMGISRSPTLVIAYIMKYLRMSFTMAFQYLEKIRPIIEPNIGFIYQLEKYQKNMYK